jgi:Carboxypeptidase regulatory-like domain
MNILAHLAERRPAPLSLTAIALLLHATVASGQTSGVRGRVVDQDTRAGIPGVLLKVAGSGPTVMTDATGAFTIRGLGAGVHRLDSRMLGYGERSDTVRLQDGEEVSLIVPLSRSPIILEPISVEARVGTRTAWLGSRGFFQRGEAGQARLHLTQEQMVHRTARNLRDVLRLTPGVQVRSLVDGGGTLWLEPSPLPDGARCQVGVFLNGSEVEFGKFTWKGVRWNQTAMRPMRFDDLLSLEEVDGIELYGPDESPVASDTCGTLLLWSEKVRAAVDEPFVGTLRGKAIRDETGQPMTGIRVTLRPSGITVVTDSLGEFEIPDLAPGDYDVIAELPGAGAWSGKVQVRAYGTISIELRIEGEAQARSRAAASPNAVVGALTR